MTPEENNDKPARPRIRLVCVAKTYIEKVQAGLVFREVTADGSLGNERIYSQKSLKHIRVGAVYEVEIDAEKPTSIYTHTLRWLHLWENKTEAAVWQASADAFDTLEVVRRQQKKDERRKLPLELLEPIREEYRKTNAAGRLALEVRVLAYLRRVTISEEPQ
jgi:hypothetical protein